ncbi:carboxy terminal-processing peptidase [Cocleimonas sp. KMM 6892]|uniref:carboxy terminal-processing peptidase n=1 Tax=unclassified Cocleimonas TaxID=2639732 RepID=UPI002DBB62C2|nr:MULTISPECIES: carboxy terminal-processing peptidase [unclassified Cocleimonas]MEB8432251.1 carboxy terminal-processing peptidase [Cocleimonas sp. KMM 6892]MEC4714663.1 carboxy terminal-processing peptidase [Cocleimonas sp. KMM 6895]MEC4744523.1 carboxy terminal-processing peptidase [Cocleimonas sp. KMM 6896]
MTNTINKLKTLKLNSVLKVSLLSGLISISVGCLGTPPAGTSLIESANAAEKTDTNLEQLTPRHSFEYKIINSMLKRYHYKKFELNDEFSGKILDQYIKQLDPSRIYFTQADITQFDKHRDKFDDYINAGETEVAVNIFKKYQQRVNERSQYAIQRLDQKFDLTKDEEYNLDREKARWEVNSTALNILWDKRIKNDYINQILSDEKPKEVISKLKKRYASMTKRTNQIKSNELFQTIVNAYAGAIEPHTSYLSPRSSEQFDINMSLSLSGIGAVLRTDEEHTKIISVVPGGPADLTGQIKAGDRIIGVGQKTENSIKDIVGWRLSDVVNIIRGKKGSTVVLSVLPNETGLSGKAKTVKIVRDKIKLEHQAASKRIIEIERPEGKVKVGVIDLPSFYIDFKARNRGDAEYAGTTRDVKKLLIELNKEGIDDLIIDLRGNGGGSLSEVVSLTGLFIDQGPVVQINDTTGRTDILRDNDSGVVYNGPMAVMIDKGSASASEIFAGAIQDYKRGVIIGETTFGKGTVQTVLPLESYTRKTFDKPLGQIKITSAQFFRVNGESTQHKGVVPDLSWDLPQVDGDFGERAFKNALPWRRIEMAKHKDYKNAFGAAAIQQARTKSLERISNDPKFKTTVDRVKLLVDAGNEKVVSLNLKKRQAKREDFNKRLLALENNLQKANGLPAYKTIKELRDAQEKKNDDIFTKQPVDVFLNEAAHILTDLQKFNVMAASANK